MNRSPGHRFVSPFRVVPRLVADDDASHLCTRCGLEGGHVSWADCIRQLRDQIANLEIEIVKLQPAKRPKKLSGVMVLR